MGYPVRTVNLNIMSLPFRKVSSAQKWDVVQALEHDFRQYEYLGKNLPRHINEHKVKDNLILYINPFIAKKLQLQPTVGKTFKFEELKDLTQRVDETLKVFAEINEKEKEKRKYLEEKLKIKITANPFVGFIINFSKLAQKEIVEKLGIEYIADKVKNFVLTFFEDIMGSQVLYLVCHLDESSPHFHGMIKNYRTYKYKFVRKKDLIEDVYFNYLLEKLRIIDLKEKIANGLFKTFSGSFSSNTTELKRPDSYKLPFSFLQDITALYFRDLGFERGKPKEERLAEGEPYWKIISRDVKTLHEDLPKEIAFKKEELKFVTDLLLSLNGEKEKLLEEKRLLEEELMNLQIHKEKIEKVLKEKEEKLKNIEKEINEKEKEFFFLDEKCKEITDKYAQKEKSLIELENELEKIEKRIKELKIRYNSLKKEEKDLWEEIRKLRKEKVCSEDELEFIFLTKQILNSSSLEEIEKIEEKLKNHKFLQLLQMAKEHIDKLQMKEAKNAEDYEISIKEIIERDEKVMRLFYDRIKQLQQYESEKLKKEK